MCPVQIKVTENPAKITPENTKTDKGGAPETKQVGVKQEEVTPYFDIQNGKISLERIPWSSILKIQIFQSF